MPTLIFLARILRTINYIDRTDTCREPQREVTSWCTSEQHNRSQLARLKNRRRTQNLGIERQRKPRACPSAARSELGPKLKRLGTAFRSSFPTDSCGATSEFHAPRPLCTRRILAYLLWCTHTPSLPPVVRRRATTRPIIPPSVVHEWLHPPAVTRSASRRSGHAYRLSRHRTSRAAMVGVNGSRKLALALFP
jgi:hypothetical protein